MLRCPVRSCLGDATFAAYVDGDLTPGEVTDADAHVDECAECRAHLSALATANTVRSFVAPAASATSVSQASEPNTGSTEPVPGSAIGRYLVEAELGRGGMGVVLRAFDPELERAVAIKLVAPSAPELASGARRARLRAEARVMARLRHPNVVAVHDVGVVGERLFIAMELVDGDTLTRWLARSGRGRALALWLDAARGVAAAHAAGLVHGDIKPDNILVRRDDRALISDFGLARPQLGPSDHVLSGTPPHMFASVGDRRPRGRDGTPAAPRADHGRGRAGGGRADRRGRGRIAGDGQLRSGRAREHCARRSRARARADSASAADANTFLAEAYLHLGARAAGARRRRARALDGRVARRRARRVTQKVRRHEGLACVTAG